MAAKFHLAGFALLLAMHCAHAQSGSTALTRPAVDASIFRPGEVRRFTNQHGLWRSICDEVTRLNQRFCSLETSALDGTGRLAARILISTSENGKPAALATLPLGIHLGIGLRIQLPAKARSQAKSKSPPGELIVPVIQCGGENCTAAWALSQQEIAALNSGGGLTVRFMMIQSLHPFAAEISALRWHVMVEAKISPEGFRDAVAASAR